MTLLRIQPSTLSGELTVPPSKSQTLRALLFATLARGRSRIRNYLRSPDTYAMCRACKQLGAKIEITKEWIQVEGVDGNIALEEGIVDAGNSGIVLRFIAAVACLSNRPIQLTGDQSIRTKRPMRPLLNALEMLGASVSYDPYTVCGPLRQGVARLDGQDSQPVSALLIASAFRNCRTTLYVDNPGEIPWVELTLHWFDRLGIRYRNLNFRCYEIEGNSSISAFDYVVPADLSSLSFPVAAALITGSELTVKGIDWSDPQGDKKLFGTLCAMGALLDFGADALHIRPESVLSGLSVDINEMIDTICVLSAIGCGAKGITVLTGAGIARQKECDRLSCTALEFKKMGAKVFESADALEIRGGPLLGAQVEAHGDHRLAMALAVAALGAQGETSIAGAGCIEKTYPTFVEDFQKIGAKISWDQIPSAASFAVQPGASPTEKLSASSSTAAPRA